MKALILGLDGATFDVIDKFSEQELPCLKRIISHGVRTSLESTFPPVTGPAWVSFATGKNPGKTGVFCFLNRTSAKTYKTKPLTSAELKQAGSFWDYLCDSGLEIGIWNYPRLYPPYPIKGFMTGGFGCSPSDDFTYPQELKEKLLSICGGYTITVPYMKPRYNRNPSLFIADAMKLLNQNEKALNFLLQQNLDAFVGVISVTDFAQHYMWRFLDKTHPLYDEKKAKRYKPAFLQIWQRIDKIVENVLANTAADTDIFIVSDHGFGTHRQSFYINSWLESQGYLVRKKGKATLIAKSQSLALRAISKFASLSPHISEVLTHRGHKYARPLLNQIKMEKTAAFAGAHATNSGQIYINSFSQSPLQNEREREQIKKEIAEKLRRTLNKLNMRVNIYFREDIYSGELLRLAPDILFEINDFECSVHGQFNKSIYRDVPHDPNHSGSHRRNGIFIAHGPNIKRGIEIEDARIYDVAPTILHLMGVPIPNDMDGQVLMGIFRDDSEAAKRPVRYQEVEEKSRIVSRISELKTLRKV